jgi:hypothetical protein
MYKMVLCLIVDIVVERKIVEQGLWAEVELPKVWIDRSVSWITSRNIASLWTGFDGSIRRAGAQVVVQCRKDSLGKQRKAYRPKCRCKLWRRYHDGTIRFRTSRV